MSRERLSKSEIIDKKNALAISIINHPESLQKALEEAGVKRSTYYSWKKNDPDFVKKIETLEDLQFDFVEGKLMENIARNDTRSIIFYLETKGKDRGYSKKKEIEKSITVGGAIAIPNIDPEKWKSIAQHQQRALSSDKDLKTFDMEDSDGGQ